MDCEYKLQTRNYEKENILSIVFFPFYIESIISREALHIIDSFLHKDVPLDQLELMSFQFSSDLKVQQPP